MKLLFQHPIQCLRSRWRNTRRSSLVPESEPPLRSELFGLVQLENHARLLAARHAVDPGPGSEQLLRRLDENEAAIRESHRLVILALHGKRSLSPAAEWFLDNYYLVEEQIDLAKAHLPTTYSRQLPRLRSGPLKDFPRVYDLTLDLVSHTDGRIDFENLSRFIRAYQEVATLNLGELWAVPIMLRFTLIESLRRVACRIAWHRRLRDQAHAWAERFVQVAQETPKRFITVLADFVRSEPPTAAPFMAELSAGLEGQHPALGFAINWIEQELAERGQTIELIHQAESHDQAADQASIANTITSLRCLGAIDWPKFVESLSRTEAVLRRDPLGAYARMDFRSRDRYRHRVERIARQNRCPEEQVAEAAVHLAASRRQTPGHEPRERHVGYFLDGPGRDELQDALGHRPGFLARGRRFAARHAFGLYLAAIALATLLLAIPFALELPPRAGLAGGCGLAGALAIVLLAVSRSAVTLVNWAVNRIVPPRGLPRLDFSAGIPPEHRTAVVVPTLLTSQADARGLLETLELRYLANRGPNLLFGLLTDFPDADRETRPDDAPLLQAAVNGIRELNARYAEKGPPIFFLLHRPRRWNAAEGVWMAYERKRGKIEQFNGLIRRGEVAPFGAIEAEVNLLRSVKHVITLDTDTQLPPETAWKLVGTMAHPLNRPHLNPVTRCVDHGYGILQPRLGIGLVSARRSRFAALFAGEVGIDPYTREVSNTYQDLFGVGQFMGKGIYDVEAFDTALAGRFPENRILSHDLIEGGHARCGFANEMELIEDYPSSCLADSRRRHRWTRGDWQIARWVLPRVPAAHPPRVANPLTGLTRWMIFDNLRRSLVPLALVAAFVLGGMACPAAAARWTLTWLALYFLPDIVRMAGLAWGKDRKVTWRVHGWWCLSIETRAWTIGLLELAHLPFQAWTHLDAIARVGWRLLIGHRRLLKWTTAATAEETFQYGLAQTVNRMRVSPCAALLAAILLARSGTPPAAPVVLILLLWWLAPVIAWFFSRSRTPRAPPLSEAQTWLLRKLARRTWMYFEHLVGPEHNWLPPDNYQVRDAPQVAARTSPTNIGLALLSNLAAYDLGYLPAGGLLARTENTLAVMEKMERYQGHFLNWYDTKSLAPLPPRYVSSVDSGNLFGSVFTLRSGLKELLNRPILPERWRAGLEESAAILIEEIDAWDSGEFEGADRPDLPAMRKAVRALQEKIRHAPPHPAELQQLLAECPTTLARLKAESAGAEEFGFWIEALGRQCEALRQELAWLAPWIEGPADPLRRPGGGETIARLLEEVSSASLSGLAAAGTRWTPRLQRLIQQGGEPARAAEAWLPYLNLASERAGERIRKIEDLVNRCEEATELDLDFLYDEGRRLLSLGYNLDRRQRDPANYDMLASEARLTSFVAVARGWLPVEHWFHMGRQLAPGGGAPVLLSWSGSLFEYLMPLLIMPTFEGTLLNESARGAVSRQIQYGRRHGIPWGISESGFNEVDAQMTYQYRAFGIPGLGLKRGLADDLVVAPYAAALALLVDVRPACANLQDMADRGWIGRFGLYEAVDFTPGRVQADERFAIVRSHMAHHSGMSLLAFVSVLCEQPMQRRFRADPQMRAAELLLQERIPLARSRIGHEVSDSPEIFRAREARRAAVRSFDTAATPFPEVHLLSNGRYHVMVTAAGGGYSRWQDLALTRWREDATGDPWGTFLYVKDVGSGRAWSAAFQPMRGEFDHYSATYSRGMAEFQSVRERIQVHTRVSVSPEDDIELRQMQVTNLSGFPRTLEITSYAEVVLTHPQSELAHPAFHGLFIEAEALRDKSILLFRRRPRSPDEKWPGLFHMLIPHGVALGDSPSFEAARDRFLGRGRTPAAPLAMEGTGPLSNTGGYVLDPVAAIRRQIRLRPGQTVTLNAVTGVGPDRSQTVALAEKYLDPRLAERVFDLAWTHSQVLLHEIRATEEDAQIFGRMAGCILYANPRLRSNPSVIARNRKGQSALWSYGISGDLPIVLLRISDQANLGLVRQIIQAHSYWRHKGLRVDLVIWAEAYAGYRQSLLDTIVGLVHAGPEAKILDQPGGIFVRNLDQVPEDDRPLMLAAARMVLNDRAGNLETQMKRRLRHEASIEPFEATRKPEPPSVEDRQMAERGLIFFNGLGGFTVDGREYVIVQKPGATTPAPWSNVLANPGFGSVVTESGSAYTWMENAHEFRLTPWHNDPVASPSGEAFYIRDEESGAFWSPSPWPARGPTPYVCRHGLGYSAFEHTEGRIASELFTYVALDAPVKFFALRLRNLSDRARRLTVTGFCEWVLGRDRIPNAMHVVTRMDPQTAAIFASNAFNFDFAERVAFFQCNEMKRSLTGDRREFLGRNRALADPQAMHRQRLSNSVGAGLDPCAAIQAVVEIPPGQECALVFTLGAAPNESAAKSLLTRFGGPDGARQALEAVWEFWKHQLGGIYLETPDAAVNFLTNHWLPYQVLAARFWGRSGFYQSGGAYGFRDQLQDSLAFLHEGPWLTREHLLRCAARQFPEGDVQHWWHPPAGRGVRTRIADDHLWLAYVAARYVRTTGDTGVLDEAVPFLDGRRLNPGEESCYDLPQVSARTAPLYEHCVLAIRQALRFGPHGLPLMKNGDWNDGMNRVGHEEKGESVWLAFFLCDVLNRFAAVAEKRNDPAFAQECRLHVRNLTARIDLDAWDGQWYRRAFFDDGRVLGGAEGLECRIDSLPQSWSVLSGIAGDERARMAMDSVRQRLVDERLGLVKLFDPPFDSAPMDPGYIKGYVPGVRENGGQYTHAAIWTILAFAGLRNAEEAWRLFDLINPIHHGDTRERIAMYQAEPYALAADVYTVRGHEGRGGWTWYTGSAAWLYQLVVEKLLGLCLEVDRLSLAPLFHPQWSEYTIHYRYRKTFYHIRVRKVGPHTWNTVRLLVDNVEQPDKQIHLVDDKKERTVLVEVG